MANGFKILRTEYLDEYSEKLNINWADVFRYLSVKNTYSADDFEYYIQSSATYSSNSEGNSIDIDTYLKNKKI